MTDHLGMATVLRHDGRIGLRYERQLAHPPAKVWRAITESEHLRHWLPCDIVGDRRAGADLVLPFWPAHVERYEIEEPVLHGTIRVWDPPSVFEWTWDTEVLRFELTPSADGAATSLVFTTWLADTNPPAGTAAGYHVCLANLVTLLDTGSAPPLVDADVRVWDERYAALVASG